MNFSDKVKGDEFMNLPEVEDDIEEEELEEEDDNFFKVPPIFDLLNHKKLTREEDMEMRKEKIDRNIELFQYINERLTDIGYEDKTERLEIINMIMG